MSDFHLLMLTKHWPKQILGVSFFFEHWLWSPERCQDRPIYKKQKSACKKLWCRSLWDEVRDDWQDGNTTSSSTLKPVSWFLLKVCSFFFAQKQCSRKGSSYASKGGKKIKIFSVPYSPFAQWHKIRNHKVLVCAVVFPGHSVPYNMQKSRNTSHSNHHRDTPHSTQLLCCNSMSYSQECNYRNLTLDHLFWSCAAASRNSLKESLKGHVSPDTTYFYNFTTHCQMQEFKLL